MVSQSERECVHEINDLRRKAKEFRIAKMPDRMFGLAHEALQVLHRGSATVANRDHVLEHVTSEEVVSP